ncbi:MAG TPA: hypothetical protein VLT83_04290 [Opitutaceae bacterium]|nr:hypothetical protein [Opitutaceae bacterium]
MKTTLKLALLVLGAALPCIAFAGLVGLSATTTFFSGEVVFSIFAAAGLALISLNDYTYRRTAIETSSVRACPVIPFSPARGHREGVNLAA